MTYGVLVQVRAMQIIDELETRRRGPYGGGIGHVSFTGGMDMALALRTMVILNPAPAPGTAEADVSGMERAERQPRSNWTVHLQARCSQADTAMAAPLRDGLEARCD
jgi:anthranilate synthase component 1